jgi:hypothetical protein
MKWFGVQTFYRTRIEGSPSGRDEKYVPGLSSVEERVVLFRARNGQSAIRKALREGRRYCAGTASTNVYDQRVVTELLRYAVAHEMDGEPGEGTEVFSAIELAAARESSASILKRKAGREAGAEAARMFIAGSLTKRLDEELTTEWDAR